MMQRKSKQRDRGSARQVKNMELHKHKHMRNMTELWTGGGMRGLLFDLTSLSLSRCGGG